MSDFKRKPTDKVGQPTLMFYLAVIPALIASIFFVSTAMAAGAGNVHGVWRTHNGELVRFFACGSQICGQLVSSRAGISKDKYNPNPKLRNRPVKGLTIIRSRRKTGPQKWSGTVYSVKDGKTYRGSLKMVSANRAQMTGCDGPFCQSATWTKITKTRVAGN